MEDDSPSEDEFFAAVEIDSDVEDEASSAAAKKPAPKKKRKKTTSQQHGADQKRPAHVQEKDMEDGGKGSDEEVDIASDISHRQEGAIFPSEDADAELITSFFRGEEVSRCFKLFGSKRQAEAWMNKFFNSGQSDNGTYNVTAEVEKFSGKYVVKITKVLDENQFGECDMCRFIPYYDYV